jgi:DNA-binding transcriptional regulator YiaG
MTPKQIRNLRLALDLSMDAFAAKLGYDSKQRRGTVWSWETGRRKPSAPVMKMLERMAKGRKL